MGLTALYLLYLKLDFFIHEYHHRTSNASQKLLTFGLLKLLNTYRIFWIEAAAYNQMRLVFRGGFYCLSCNAEEGEVERIMI